MADFEKVILAKPIAFDDFKPLSVPLSPDLAAFIERRRQQLFMDVNMQVYDPIFRDYCVKMAAISGRSHLDIAEAGYGLSDEAIPFKKA